MNVNCKRAGRVSLDLGNKTRRVYLIGSSVYFHLQARLAAGSEMDKRLPRHF
jgi:hypothetical protein